MNRRTLLCRTLAVLTAPFVTQDAPALICGIDVGVPGGDWSARNGIRIEPIQVEPSIAEHMENLRTAKFPKTIWDEAAAEWLHNLRMAVREANIDPSLRTLTLRI